MDENELSYKVIGAALELHRNKVIVEVKSIEALAPVHFAQTLTYLRISNKKLALIINFNCKLLKYIIRDLRLDYSKN